MKNLLQKYRLVIVLSFLIVWSFIVESPFQKGGINHNMHYVIYFLTVIIGYIYLSPHSYPKFIVAEKILYSLISSLIALIVGGMGTSYILEIFYQEDYYLKCDPIFSNLVFYLLSNLVGIGLLQIIIEIKNRMATNGH